jgi:carbon-monoxide dehydrogenase large subunit
MGWIGTSVKRVEDPALLTGKGRFVDDMHLPNMLQAAMVRSPHAHALIRGIDASDALAMPGVHAVLTHADLPEAFQQQIPSLVPNAAIRYLVTQRALAMDAVHFAGEAVAIVVADDRYIAEDAVDRVIVDYDPLPAAGDFRRAAEASGPPSHTGHTDNIAATFSPGYGNVDSIFAHAPHVFSEELFQHRGAAHSMETRTMLLAYDPVSEMLSIWANTQTPHRMRDVLCRMTGWADNKVRVVAPDTGGGFGAKGQVYPEHVAVAAATMKLGRPVKYIEDRREHFLATHQERDQLWNVEIAVDDDGKILGLRGSLLHDAGAYLPWGVVTPFISATTMPGPYIVPAYRMDVTCVFTNKVATTPVRGAGRPQAAFAMERLMDRAARELGLDPAEIRRRNFVPADAMPYKVGLTFRDGSPVIYDSGDYPECQEKALALADYDGFRARQEAARREGRYIGIATASYIEGTGLGPFEGVSLRITPAGKIIAETGASAQGQGHQTMLGQIIADGLGIAPEDITVIGGESTGVAYGVGTFASRVTANAGSSAHIAAGNVREKAIRIAAHLLEAAEEDLDLADGRVFVKGVPEHGKTFAELAAFANGMPGFSMPEGITPGLDDTSYFTPERSTYANGSHVAEVEVDVETGRVTILNYSTAHDCGTIINPIAVEGQVAGGVVHGIGNALYEWMRYDDDAQPVTVNFGEYLLPLATDTPPIRQVHMETPTPLNPLGVKGAGEGGTIPAIAVIIGAIDDALAPFGVKITQVPVTPEYLLGLIEQNR